MKALHELPERIYAKAGKRTKRAVSRVPLTVVGWTCEHTVAFNACKQAIFHRTALTHRDEAKRLCIYNDASDSHWSGIVTQVSHQQQLLQYKDQDHKPLAFHLNRFSKTRIGRLTPKKGAFAVMASNERAHWLASCADGFDLFTDYNNFIYIFDSLAVMPDIGDATTRKVLR